MVAKRRGVRKTAWRLWRAAKGCRRRRNPGLRTGTRLGPGAVGAKHVVMLRFVQGGIYELGYERGADGQPYLHNFDPADDAVYLAESSSLGKCIVIMNINGKPLWE